MSANVLQRQVADCEGACRSSDVSMIWNYLESIFGSRFRTQKRFQFRDLYVYPLIGGKSMAPVLGSVRVPISGTRNAASEHRLAVTAHTLDHCHRPGSLLLPMGRLAGIYVSSPQIDALLAEHG